MQKFRTLLSFGFLFAFTAAAEAQVMNCRATAAAPSYAEAVAAPCSLDLSGNMRTVTSLAANSSVNVNQVGGTAVDTNSGNKSAGTLRVTLATDQVQLTNALKVDGSAVTQPVSGPLTDTQLRASAVPVSISGNQAVNVAQINGVTPLMGAGNTGTGSPRVTQSTDQAALAAWGHGATSSAVPAGATYTGVRTSAGLTGNIGCGNSVVYDASTSGSTELVAISGSTAVYVCGYSIMAAGTVNVKLITGTGSACATGSANITPAWQLTAQAGLVDGSPYYRGLKGAASSALCINASGAVAVQAIVYYTQF